MENFLPLARLISSSKSGYSNRYPSHIVIFNANFCTKSKGKIWYGDIDLTVDLSQIMELRKEVGEDIFILSEMDARFENEANPKLERARAIVLEQGISLPGG